MDRVHRAHREIDSPALLLHPEQQRHQPSRPIMAMDHVGIQIQSTHYFDDALAEKDKPVMVVLVVALAVGIR